MMFEHNLSLFRRYKSKGRASFSSRKKRPYRYLRKMLPPLALRKTRREGSEADDCSPKSKSRMAISPQSLLLVAIFYEIGYRTITRYKTRGAGRFERIPNSIALQERVLDIRLFVEWVVERYLCQPSETVYLKIAASLFKRRRSSSSRWWWNSASEATKSIFTRYFSFLSEISMVWFLFVFFFNTLHRCIWANVLSLRPGGSFELQVGNDRANVILFTWCIFAFRSRVNNARVHSTKQSGKWKIQKLLFVLIIYTWEKERKLHHRKKNFFLI